MLSIPSVWIQSAVIFAIWYIFMYLLNSGACNAMPTLIPTFASGR